jgi:hypothetical protein
MAPHAPPVSDAWCVSAPPLAFSFLYAAVFPTRASRRVALLIRTPHNLLLAAYSAAVAVAVARHWQRTRLVSVCGPTEPLPRWLVVSWYASKWWEWADTAILVARGRAVGRLHYYHHAFTATLVALQTYRRETHTPLYEIGTFLNAVVHAAMYLYYAFPAALAPVRRAITVAQCLQHLAMVACIAVTLREADCETDAFGNRVGAALYLFFFVEFAMLALRRDARPVGAEAAKDK